MDIPKGQYLPPGQDWWSVRASKDACPRCHETRLVSVVEDYLGKQWYCDVCSKMWRKDA
jgi:ssDNA-binding Zn-finger/Zn-ribbon topoisomerase 1